MQMVAASEAGHPAPTDHLARVTESPRLTSTEDKWP